MRKLANSMVRHKIKLILGQKYLTDSKNPNNFKRIVAITMENTVLEQVKSK